jgi:hypothetical protein
MKKLGVRVLERLYLLDVRSFVGRTRVHQAVNHL